MFSSLNACVFLSDLSDELTAAGGSVHEQH